MASALVMWSLSLNSLTGVEVVPVVLSNLVTHLLGVLNLVAVEVALEALVVAAAVALLKHLLLLPLVVEVAVVLEALLFHPLLCPALVVPLLLLLMLRVAALLTLCLWRRVIRRHPALPLLL